MAVISAQSCGWLMTPVKDFTNSGMVSSEMADKPNDKNLGVLFRTAVNWQHIHHVH
jgi:hypothetical protein